MPGVRVKVVLDKSKLNPFLVDVTTTTSMRAAGRVRDRAKSNVVSSGRVDTGKLRDSFYAKQTSVSPELSTAEVGSKSTYASYQEEGIGPVVAQKGKVLRFKPKGATAFIFRPRTKGFPGAHFLKNAYRAITLRDFLP